MGHVLTVFTDASIAAVSGVVVTGLYLAVKKLYGISRDVKHVLGSMGVIYTAFPYLITAIKHQNDALKGLGANGDVKLSNTCLHECEKVFDDRLAKVEGEAS